MIMSFGTSPSDVDIVVAFCKALYRKCREVKDAGGEYDEISHEVRGMRLEHTSLYDSFFEFGIHYLQSVSSLFVTSQD